MREGGIVEGGKGGGREGRLESEKEARVLDGEREGGNGWMEGSRGGQVGGREEGI